MVGSQKLPGSQSYESWHSAPGSSQAPFTHTSPAPQQID
jgi:hypothetical protein